MDWIEQRQTSAANSARRAARLLTAERTHDPEQTSRAEPTRVRAVLKRDKIGSFTSSSFEQQSRGSESRAFSVFRKERSLVPPRLASVYGPVKHLGSIWGKEGKSARPPGLRRLPLDAASSPTESKIAAQSLPVPRFWHSAASRGTIGRYPARV